MRKLKIDNSQLKIKHNFLILCLLFILSIVHCPLSIPVASATDSTPSADIRVKLEQLKAEIASKAAKLKLEISSKLTNKAYIGKVKTKSNTTLTLASKNGSRIINITQDTDFESRVKGKKFSQKTIVEEDYLASLGDVDENGVLTAKRIILLPTTNLQSKTYLWGQVVGASDKLITLKDKDSKSVAVSIPNSFSVKVGDFVILTGTLGKNEIFEAEFVYVLKKIVAPSAKVATNSATPSAKKKSP